MYGNSGNNVPIEKDIKTDSIAAIRTDIDVAFFQNNATRKITKIPGVNIPVKF
jgi:hypothetical protein